MYQKKEKIFVQKMSPHLSQLIKLLRWFKGIILGKIICESSNWQHIIKIENHYPRCKLATF